MPASIPVHPCTSRTMMPALDIDLNREPWDLNEPMPSVDWDDIGEQDGPAHELGNGLVLVDGDEGGAQQGQGAGDGEAAPSDSGAAADAGQGSAGGEGSNVRKRRFYSDDIKVAIYLELLAKTDPPVMRHGVSKQVAKKFGVSLRTVQQVWRNGQDYGGVEGVKNKLVNNVGRKRVEIDPEAIKNVPLSDRTTLQKLAKALGVKKTTLHKRLKEGYFHRHNKHYKSM